LRRVKEALETQIPGDLVAMDIRNAIYYLGEITGAISSDDLLGNIFSKFYIGK
jgi:tRNA modification GTPase